MASSAAGRRARYVLSGAVAGALLGACTTPSALRASQPTPAPEPVTGPPSLLTPEPQVIGRSVQGRALVAYRLGSTSAPRRVLIVGVVHGDEAAGRVIADDLKTSRPARTEIVIIPDLNPDGVARNTRQNARGVDLNRNFPWGWVPGGRPGDQQYPGRSPLSEPESRAIAGLIRQLRPTVTIWFHQPVGVVDESGGSHAVEQRFALLAGEPLRRLTRYPGSAASWQNALLPTSTAFVVELPHTVSAGLRTRVEAAVHDLAP
jgi:protein MpaA